MISYAPFPNGVSCGYRRGVIVGPENTHQSRAEARLWKFFGRRCNLHLAPLHERNQVVEVRPSLPTAFTKRQPVRESSSPVCKSYLRTRVAVKAPTSDRNL